MSRPSAAYALMNLYLIGYRGSGKTTVARELAQLLNWKWLDADEELERRADRSIKQIFADGGELEFRELEAAVVADLAKLDQHILALGGGAVLREENRRAIQATGKTVWLRARPQTLLQRISQDRSTAQRRPNLTAGGGLEEIHQLLTVRTPIYQQAANYIVDCDDRPAGEIATEIAAWAGSISP